MNKTTSQRQPTQSTTCCEVSSADRLVGFILAAGEGRRLRPATLQTPKAAVPFCGRPLVVLAAAKLAGLPICELIVNTCHLGQSVETALAEYAALPHSFLPPIHISREPELLNTGGGLRKGLSLIPQWRTCIVANADVVADFPLARLLAEHRSGRALATLLLIPGRGPQTVDLDADGLVASFRKPKGEAPYTFSGIYVFERPLLDYLPETRAPSIVEAMENALHDGRAVRGLVAEETCYWNDLGTMQSYIDAHRHARQQHWPGQPLMQEAVAELNRRIDKLAAGGVNLSGGIGLGRDVQVAPGSQLHDCVVWDEVEIAEKTAFSFGVLSASPPPLREAPSWRPDDRILQTLAVERTEIKLEKLAEQGSGRLYQRLETPSGNTFVWMAYSQNRPENAHFATCANFLRRCGVRTPEIVVHLPDVGEALLEDLGDLCLRDIGDPGRRLAVLTKAVKMAAKLHALGGACYRRQPIPLQEPFADELYRWEKDYFLANALTGAFHMEHLWHSDIEDECRRGRQILLRNPQTLVHRDLQSANIMLKGDDVVFIDCQGMRFGVGAYDVASLLYDPYVCFSGDVRERMWRLYGCEIRAFGEPAPSDECLTAGAVQRLLQALGAYGKLWLRDQRPWFAQFLQPGAEMLAQATAHSTHFPRLHDLACRLAQKRISVASRESIKTSKKFM